MRYNRGMIAPRPASPVAPIFARWSVMLVMLVVMLGITQLSCNTNCQDPKNASSVGCVIENAVVDCTGVSSLATGVAVVQPIVDQLIASVTLADGTIVWATIEQQIVDLGLKYGTCVIAAVWNNYVNGIPPAVAGSGSAVPAIAAGSGVLAKTRFSAADLSAEFERIRAKVAPGRKFKIGAAIL